MNRNREICVVILNWNRSNDLCILLHSLENCLSYFFKNNGFKPDIVVIDNCSTDDSVEMVKSKFPYVNIIVSPENLGGSGGFNLGLRYAIEKGYQYVWLLDNDAVIKGDALSPLYKVLKNNADIALAGSKILHKDNTNIISELGADLSDFTTFPVPFLKNVENELVSKGIVIDVDYVAACSLLGRIAAIREVGILDNNYFLMWDDMEWGIRFRNYGYRVVAVSDSEVIHPGFSERVINPKLSYYSWRNHLYFVYKNLGPLKKVFVLPYINGLLSKNIVKFRVNGRQDISLSLHRAQSDFWNGIMGKYLYAEEPDNGLLNDLNDLPRTLSSLKRANLKLNLVVYNAFPFSVFKKISKEIDFSGIHCFVLVDRNRKKLFELSFFDKCFIECNFGNFARLIDRRGDNVLVIPNWISVKLVHVLFYDYIMKIGESGCVSVSKASLSDFIVIFVKKVVSMPYAFLYGYFHALYRLRSLRAIYG